MGERLAGLVGLVGYGRSGVAVGGGGARDSWMTGWGGMSEELQGIVWVLCRRQQGACRADGRIESMGRRATRASSAGRRRRGT